MAHRGRLELAEGDHDILVRLSAPSAGRARMAVRARIVLLAAEGTPAAVIARHVGTSRPTVDLWRGRYLAHGLDGLADHKRPGRPPRVGAPAILRATVVPPTDLPGGAWSSRRLAAEFGISHTTVASTWAAYGLQPEPRGILRFATAPVLRGEVLDIQALYLHDQAGLIVLRVADEHDPGTSAPSHARAGSRSLVGTLHAADPSDLRRPSPDRIADLLAFLSATARRHPMPGLHIVVDRPELLREAAFRNWLAGHPRIRSHAVGSRRMWLRLVELWTGLAEVRLRGPEEFDTPGRLLRRRFGAPVVTFDWIEQPAARDTGLPFAPTGPYGMVERPYPPKQMLFAKQLEAEAQWQAAHYHRAAALLFDRHDVPQRSREEHRRADESERRLADVLARVERLAGLIGPDRVD